MNVPQQPYPLVQTPPQRRAHRSPAIRAVVSAAIVLLITAAAVALHHGARLRHEQSSARESAGPRSEHSWPLAVRLASIDYGELVGEGDPRVVPYRKGLQILATKCTSTEQQIADATVVAQEQLARQGVQQSLIQIMRGVSASIPPEAYGTFTYPEVCAAYVVLQE